MKGILLIFSIFVTFLSFGQNKVQWDFGFDNESSSLVMTANIEEGWHLYSQIIDNEIGPIPTEFEFITNDNYQLIGSTLEPKPIEEYDPNFEGDLSFFKSEVTFTQEIENVDAASVEGVVTYMVCNDVMCMPPVDIEFTITLN